MPVRDESVVKARKATAPRDPTLGRWASGEAASAWERSMSVQRCSYVVEGARTASGAERA
ncbi:MAG: hypothetical protein AVDCRST_MAG01-01-4113 [uncultured Rubrobacteraceae bacterium]|uniref:Uncharacterized protein n=1 Tax=uncultured Rubrobacteraceae bacterium TaxID=349277 RepID=A0A6J4QJ07_9ACTN|nr:MAG: hypothetical protein AVDCRST_MAG01-01-4113 [uncultured Rubrobacteraceae bacterium]